MFLLTLKFTLGRSALQLAYTLIPNIHSIRPHLNYEVVVSLSSYLSASYQMSSNTGESAPESKVDEEGHEYTSEDRKLIMMKTDITVNISLR